MGKLSGADIEGQLIQIVMVEKPRVLPVRPKLGSCGNQHDSQLPWELHAFKETRVVEAPLASGNCEGTGCHTRNRVLRIVTSQISFSCIETLQIAGVFDRSCKWATLRASDSS